RVALLALYFAAPAFAQGVTEAEMRADVEGATTIEAEQIEGVGDIEVKARGNAEIRRDDVDIFGQTLRFNSEFGRAQGEGGVRLKKGVDRFWGPRLEYNTLEDSGTVESPNYILHRELPARGGAQELEILSRDRYRLKNATFT